MGGRGAEVAGGAKQRKLSARSAITKPLDIEKSEMKGDEGNVLEVLMCSRPVLNILLIHTCHTGVSRLVQACEACGMPLCTCEDSVGS